MNTGAVSYPILAAHDFVRREKWREVDLNYANTSLTLGVLSFKLP